MYKSFFGLKGHPFKLSPDPVFFFASNTHAKGLAYLRYGLQQGEGFVVVTGMPGTGKTTLLSTLMQELSPKDFVVIKLSNTLLNTEDLYATIAHLLNMSASGHDKAEFLEAFEQHLQKIARVGKRTLLLIDEAHNLTPRILEELRLLSNLQFHNQHTLQIFLLGQFQLEETLNLPQMLQLRQRVLVSHRLEPIELQEIGDYITHRLAIAGWRGEPSFSPGAFALIHHYTEGIPRQINTLSDRILLYVFLEEKKIVDEQVVEAVISELKEEPASYVHGREFTDREELDLKDDLVADSADDKTLQADQGGETKQSVNHKSNVLTWPADRLDARTIENRFPVDSTYPNAHKISTSDVIHAVKLQHSLAESFPNKHLIAEDEATPNVETEKNIIQVKQPEIEQPPVIASDKPDFLDKETDDNDNIEKDNHFSVEDSSIKKTTVKPGKRKRIIISVTVLLLGVVAYQMMPRFSTETQVAETTVQEQPSLGITPVFDTKNHSDIDAVGKTIEVDSSQQTSNVLDTSDTNTMVDTEKASTDIIQTEELVSKPEPELEQAIAEKPSVNLNIKKDSKPKVLSIPIKKPVLPDVSKAKVVSDKLNIKNPIVKEKADPPAANKIKKNNKPLGFETSNLAVTTKPVATGNEQANVSVLEKEKNVPIKHEQILQTKEVATETDDSTDEDLIKLEVLLTKFAKAYQAGDLNEFVSLFSVDVDSNDASSIEQLQAEYKKLFNVTDVRQIKIEDFAWEQDDDVFSGEGKFQLMIIEKGGNKPMQYSGGISLEVDMDQAEPLITDIYYSYND